MTDLTEFASLTLAEWSAEIDRMHPSPPVTEPGIPSVVCPLARFVAGDFSIEEVA